MRLGAPRRLLTADQGVTGELEGMFPTGAAVCWRQAGQSAGVRGLSSRWTLAVLVAVRHWGCRYRQIPASPASSTQSPSQCQYESASIPVLATRFQDKRERVDRIPRTSGIVKRLGCAGQNYPRRREEAPAES